MFVISAIRNVEECALGTGWFTLWSRYSTLRLSHHRISLLPAPACLAGTSPAHNIGLCRLPFLSRAFTAKLSHDSVGDLCTRYAHITCTAVAASNAFIRRWATELAHEFWTRFWHVLPFEEFMRGRRNRFVAITTYRLPVRWAICTETATYATA